MNDDDDDLPVLTQVLRTGSGHPPSLPVAPDDEGGLGTFVSTPPGHALIIGSEPGGDRPAHPIIDDAAAGFDTPVPAAKLPGRADASRERVAPRWNDAVHAEDVTLHPRFALDTSDRSGLRSDPGPASRAYGAGDRPADRTSGSSGHATFRDDPIADPDIAFEDVRTQAGGFRAFQDDTLLSATRPLRGIDLFLDMGTGHGPVVDRPDGPPVAAATEAPHDGLDGEIEEVFATHAPDVPDSFQHRPLIESTAPATAAATNATFARRIREAVLDDLSARIDTELDARIGQALHAELETALGQLQARLRIELAEALRDVVGNAVDDAIHRLRASPTAREDGVDADGNGTGDG